MRIVTLLKPLRSLPVVGPEFDKLYRSLRKDPRKRLLESLPKNARCAEIGVWQGGFSARILEETSPRELVLIDPWEFVPSLSKRWYGGAKAKSQADMDEIHESVVARFADHPEVRVVRSQSAAYLKDSKEEFDWIYIDGDHSEEPVYIDLTLSWERVVPGGYVCGDDYHWRDADGTQTVKKAVDRFVKEKGCDIQFFSSQFKIKRH